MLKKNKVVLFYPPYDGPPLGAPRCLLGLAAPLLGAGFEVTEVDAAIDPRWFETVLREARGALCLGISILTGPMIHGAIRIAKAMKKEAPEVPVIFGGWHPSLATAQTLQESYVDAVVRGQGDLTLLEIAEKLRAGEDYRGVAGVSSRQLGMPRRVPEGRGGVVDGVGGPACHVAGLGGEGRVSGERKLSYA